MNKICYNFTKFTDYYASTNTAGGMIKKGKAQKCRIPFWSSGSTDSIIKTHTTFNEEQK